MQQFENILKSYNDSESGSQNIFKNKAIRKHKHAERAIESLETRDVV